MPVYPPDPRDMESGLGACNGIAADAGASIVLTTDALWAWIEPWVRLACRVSCSSSGAPPMRSSGGVGSRVATRRSLDAGHLAFLQYTSGSTGAPKGSWSRTAT